MNPPSQDPASTAPDDSTDATIIEAHSPKPQVKTGDLPREIPVRLGRYVVDAEVGRGAMGVVYRVRQDGLNRVVALKLLREGTHASTPLRHRFDREARAISKLRHPNIVAVHEVGEYEGQSFFTMDYIDGAPLDKFITQSRVQDPVLIADLMSRIAAAVHYAHQQGILHRDLKPNNILVDRKGEPVIMDFGLAKEIEDGSLYSMTGDILGTPAFMPPEQAAGHVHDMDIRSDVYSLGAILYALLARRAPFHGRTLVETLTHVMKDDPLPVSSLNPDVDGDLGGICMKAMEKDPAKRYATAADFENDLRRFIDGLPTVARPWTRRRTVARYVVRNRKRLALAGAAVAAVVLTGIVAPKYFSRDFLDVTRAHLASGDPLRRAEAVTGLGHEIAAPEELPRDKMDEAFQLLMTAHRDADVQVQAVLLRFLAGHGESLPALDPETSAWLLGAAGQNERPELRNLAIESIGKIQRPDFAQYLIRRLNEPNVALRLLIIRSLGYQKSRAALAPLINVTITDSICRAEAEVALDRFYREGRMALVGPQDTAAKNAVRQLQRSVADHEAAIEEALNEGPVEIDPWAEYRNVLASGTAEARGDAVYVLGMSGNPDAAFLLMGALADPDVGPAAALALSRVDRDGQVSRLVENLKSELASLRGNSALALAICGKSETANELLAARAMEKDETAKNRMTDALKQMAAQDPALQPSIEAVL